MIGYKNDVPYIMSEEEERALLSPEPSEPPAPSLEETVAKQAEEIKALREEIDLLTSGVTV